MKRLHIHVSVEKLDESIRFYSALFGAEPVKTKPDYAKWLLEDPRVNFAISTRAKTKGIDHLGIQVDEEDELAELRDRLKAGDMPVAMKAKPSAVTRCQTNLGFKTQPVFHGKPTERRRTPSYSQAKSIRLAVAAARRKR